MKRLLVVPRRTSRTPLDVWLGAPNLFAPKPDLVEVSVVFRKDIMESLAIADHWKGYAKRVRIGGPALDDPGGEFVPGKYVRVGIVHTSRGCPRCCSWCYVWKREGGIRELKVKPGNIVEDSNLLACNRAHIERVFEMLKKQRAVQFKGGIDARLLRSWHIDAMQGLRIKEIWLAYDSASMKRVVMRAVDRLSRAGFSQRQIRCYVMIGKDETRNQAEGRLIEIYKAGTTPFAMRYDRIVEDVDAWKTMTTTWCNPRRYKYLDKIGWKNRRYTI